ncbi:glycosyltransferase family 2 protein [Elizabethkingia anophelis]|uniref:glycosyltransferase family 2 protein n=1 Tax=Elizabethkingia anophelis TaxID=1117645 RepID=UPI0021A46B00|nr:glycosyltransferase family 2 protein [Elizabethkingia anophelis]MCT3977721.1 glycosyltransferase family 2 protein [Elizabethkingia anophelis]MCT4041336.1 glycosyltransferase family 2 protein [Elizabethkingia anophelis]MCT4174032.1 glycosyltransferase family 2 protein [Elizabethkingia anophelis]MCT4177713.1 glycosyltransferase family 2 protein [Elizabethkingia anophelis]
MERSAKLKKISVVIPMYNAENTIARALYSVINQTYEGPFEIIVVNDGSKDSSEEVVNQFINENPGIEIKLIKQKNGGVSKARNTGLKSVSGEYIALLDSDDEWLNNKIELQYPYLYNNVCDFVTCLRNNDKISFPYKLTDNTFAHVTLKKLLIKVVGQTSTALFKSAILEQVGYFDENQKYSEDANYWMKVAKVSKMIILNEKLVITGGGKPSVGFSGLSANILEMERGVQKNIDEMYSLNYINIYEFILFKTFSSIKYLVRKIKY